MGGVCSSSRSADAVDANAFAGTRARPDPPADNTGSNTTNHNALAWTSDQRVFPRRILRASRSRRSFDLSDHDGSSSLSHGPSTSTLLIDNLSSRRNRSNFLQRQNRTPATAANAGSGDASAVELEQLQLDLATMEQLFQSLLSHAYAQMANTNNNGTANRDSPGFGANSALFQNGTVPPASSKAIRQLPTISITPDDLVEESNRECCICFLDHNLRDRVARLPCGHLYHRPCISEWLAKRCTCPICRYELQTDDTAYERGRVERMNQRKPRMRRYELDRMPLRELKDLAYNRLHLVNDNPSSGSVGIGWKKNALDKSELVQKIVDSGKIDIIAVPEPSVHYAISELREMSVGELKKAMGDAGVIIEDDFVVSDKEDLVQLFLQSGRLLVTPESPMKQLSCYSLSDGTVDMDQDDLDADL